MKLRALFALMLLAGLTGWGSAARAQCLLCGTSGTEARTAAAQSDQIPLRIEIAAQLDFSRIATGAGGGSVMIDPQTGARRLTGNLRDLGGMALTGEALITGTPGRTVRIFVPHEIELDGDMGRSAQVTDLMTDLGPAPRLGTDGRLRFRFGGRLQVASDDDGNYRGRIPITVEYE